MSRAKRRVHYGREAPPLSEWGGRLPVALAFPGGDRIALSALGWQAVYRVLSEDPGVAVERVFLEDGVAPAGRESGRKLDQFPVVAFSLGYEDDSLRILGALKSAGVPLNAAKRPDFPLMVGGGPLAFLNPAPILPALDAVFVGEAETQAWSAFMDACRAHVLEGGDKASLLESVKDMPGVYVPGRSRTPVKRQVLAVPGDTVLRDPASSCFVSPIAEFRDMLLVEINRGCPYGCRFCAAGFIYRPPRQARLDEIKKIIEDANPPKVGLVGTALTDWPDLLPLLRWFNARRQRFSMSSVRADGVTREILELMRLGGSRTLTLALEGASARLRRAVNKNLDEEDFLNAVALAGEFKINHLKIYCIAGWPGETEEDYAELDALLGRVCEAGGVAKGKKGVGHVTLGVNALIPKPWTPFQWAPMADEAQLSKAFAWVRRAAKPYKGVKVHAERPGPARLQALLSRGDERLFPLLADAAEVGWKKALKRWDGDPAAYLDRERGKDEVFPWDFMDIGVSRAYLYREWEKYKAGLATGKCPEEGCAKCGRCGMEDWLDQDGA